MNLIQKLRREPLYKNDIIGLFPVHLNLKDDACGITGGYYFDIILLNNRQKAGYISFRFGEGPVLYYLGHIGYRIHESFRGNGYACMACQCMIPLLQKLLIHSTVITTDPGNIASQKTCEKLGCILERTAPVPEEYRFACPNSTQKMRYIWLLPSQTDERKKWI